MDRKEFEKRVSEFIPKQDIDKYEERFEPAYMECEHVDKDDFCAALKDPCVRKIVTDLSAFILDARISVRSAGFTISEKDSTIKDLTNEVDQLRRCIRLIAATCDRCYNMAKKGV